MRPGAEIRSAPLVTVVISTWNRAHLVGRAIRCALAQTVEDIEVVVVDDGSTDATAVVLAGIDDHRLRRARHEHNHGISRTRNTAIGLARGDWIAFLDDDNEWPPDYLERQLAVAKSRPAAGVVYCRARVRNTESGSEWLMHDALGQGRVFGHLVAGWHLQMSATIIRRSILIEIGGLDERLRAREDTDLWLRLAQRTDFAGTSQVLLTRNDHHGAQLSRNPEYLTRDAELLRQKWQAAITAACGRMAFRGWHAQGVILAERRTIDHAISTGTGARVAAARCGRRLLPFLPWSASLLTEMLAFAILGAPGSRVIRRGWLYWYGLRRRLGVPAGCE
jgi:glycosyltransferase involved in cell wall biosynthesis